MSRLTRRRTRFRVGADVVAETAAGIVIRLDESPEGEDGRTVTVLLHPDVTPFDAMAELYLLADELDMEVV